MPRSSGSASSWARRKSSSDRWSCRPIRSSCAPAALRSKPAASRPTPSNAGRSRNCSRFSNAWRAAPTATVLNNLGVVQIRRAVVTPQTGQPAYYFTKASESDPDDPDYFFNLGYAYWLNRDAQAAIYWLREGLRRNPADGDAHFVLATALAAGGSAAESIREKELAKRLSSRYDEWDKRPAADPVPRGLERVKSDVELPHAS